MLHKPASRCGLKRGLMRLSAIIAARYTYHPTTRRLHNKRPLSPMKPFVFPALRTLAQLFRLDAMPSAAARFADQPHSIAQKAALIGAANTLGAAAESGPRIREIPLLNHYYY